jgi:hypothetical protein
MKESPTNVPQGTGRTASKSLFGIQLVRLSTRSGKAEILAMVAPVRMNQELRNRITGVYAIHLIVGWTHDGGRVTAVQA